MPLYVTVSEGDRADRAKPVLATGDQRIVRATMRAISRIVDEGEEGPSKRPRPLRVLEPSDAAR